MPVRRSALVLLLMAACSQQEELPLDCKLAQAEALREFIASSECISEVTSRNVADAEECIAKARQSVELIERAEKVCVGEILTEMQTAKANILKEIPRTEKIIAYSRGEISDEELLKVLLADD